MRNFIDKLTEISADIDENQLSHEIEESIIQTCEDNNVPYNRAYISQIASQISDSLLNGDGADPYYGH